MAHQTYENVVISNKINDILTTGININNYLTVDNTLAESAGMKKKVITYSSTGEIEGLATGEGNASSLQVKKIEKDYPVYTYQGKFSFYDEEEMTDPMIVDTGLKHNADNMINKFTEEAITQFSNGSKTVTGAWGFDLVVDAIAKLKVESTENLFLLVSVEDAAEIRKALKDDLKYSEGFVRTGYIGSIAGVPVVVSKALIKGHAFMASKEAVTVFIKKDTETEYQRDPDTRNNTYYVRKFAVVALTNDDKVVNLTINA